MCLRARAVGTFIRRDFSKQLLAQAAAARRDHGAGERLKAGGHACCRCFAACAGVGVHSERQLGLTCVFKMLRMANSRC